MLKRIIAVFLITLLALTATACVKEKEPVIPTYDNVEVHDPSVIKVEDTYYIFGSHLAAAKSEDLMHWEQISTLPRPNNPMFPDVDVTLAATLEYCETDTFWAPDVVQLDDGRYYFYYCACRGDSPLSALGVAVSDHVEGPYEDLGIFLKSGMNDGVYNANYDPNVVDPHVFFDETGKLWMVYGSYSGGIFILEMDSETGFPVDGQGYGTKLLGAYHARIEGAYIQYAKDTGYYYMFLSFGGLDANGGYNIRVVRSKNPDGPYYDSQGNEMADVGGTPGKIFDDPAYEPYGHKLMGNFEFTTSEDEKKLMNYGYISPGHNSTLYDETLDKYLIFFHTRFKKTGNAHQVRVHQFFLNNEGWPVIAPYRYSGETLATVTQEEVSGTYRLVDHGMDITTQVKKSVLVDLNKDGSVSGEHMGSWTLEGDNTITITLEDAEYSGVFIKQYSEFDNQWLMTFTAGSNKGNSLWASK